MGEVSADSVTLDLLRDAWETVRSSPLGVINTPMIPWCQTTLPLHLRCNVHIKLENMQRTEQVPTSCLMNVVNRCVQEDAMTFLHSYDDLDLIAGHASLGLEVLEGIPKPDVVVVCCGGGGLLAGVAAAIKLSGCDGTRIYGVEPDGACTMYRSFIEKKPVGMEAESIASGLAPPFAGTLPFELCQRYVEGIVLINDDEIKAAVSTLYRSGLVVEPSGCAAFAAIVNDKIPELEGKTVVCILSGGNIGKDELVNFPG
uniref:L-serine deaminase n=1 Tax=Gasterosteus aculeatus aculeatus TaxID=481459 RepID=G3Q5J1_GASAC